MGASAIGSPLLKARIPLRLNLPERARFDIQLMHKDIRLARQIGSELKTPLPTVAVADETLDTAAELGYAHRDLAAVHEALAHTSPKNHRQRPVA